MEPLTEEIASTAARLVVEEGLEYGAAKHQALKQLGAPRRAALPNNDVVEDAVLEYLALFCADSQPAELRALRELALEWMERMPNLRPHLSGAVWRGTATRKSDIWLQLFCDDPKAAELVFLDKGVRFDVSSVTGFTGSAVDALSLQALCRPLGERVGIHCLVYDFDDLRGALKPDGKGRTLRGDASALRKLLQNNA